jgi:Domain of unknown function (DUF4157)
MPLAGLQRSKPTTRTRAQRKPAHVAIAQSTAATTPLHPIVQAKLRLGALNDKYEREADRVADQVMREQGPPPQSACDSLDGPEAVQRKCAACSSGGSGLCPECEEELQRHALPVTPLVQRKTLGSGAGTNVPSIVNDVLSSSGQPLGRTTRAFFEPRFGHEFGSIRVHADSKGAEAARSVDAGAFTAGVHIAFASGRYCPDTGNGKELLAHELTHVIQQQAAGSGNLTIQRSVCSQQYPHDEYQPFNERRPATDKTALGQIGRINASLKEGLAFIVFSDAKPETLENCSGEGRPGYRYFAEDNNQGVLAVDLCNFGEPEPPHHPYPFLKYRFVCVAESGQNGEPKSCCCRVDGLQVSFAGRTDNENIMGHIINTHIDVSNIEKPAGSAGGECTLEWEETTNNPYKPGMVKDEPFQFDTETDKSFPGWQTRPRASTNCPWKGRITDTDEPRIAKSEVEYSSRYQRYIRFRITARSAPGCGDSPAEVRAEQQLVLSKGKPVWVEQFPGSPPVQTSYFSINGVIQDPEPIIVP